MKAAEGNSYHIDRRTKNKRTGDPLSGYALDVTIRVNGDGTYFLQDHNSSRNVMPHNDREELIETIMGELKRNHKEHFGHK